jgi:hypothetical protein
LLYPVLPERDVEGKDTEVMTEKQIASYHELFEKPFDSMDEAERQRVISQQDSLDLQLLGGKDVVASLLDLLMYVPVYSHERICAVHDKTG